MVQIANGPMVSEVTICNQALGWLGQDPITSLNDQSTRSELCRNNYPHLRDAVIEERMWSFATVRHKSETQDRDDWDTMYAHGVPTDWLQVFRCFCHVDKNPRYNITSPGWTLEDGVVLAQDSVVYLWGVRQVTDTGKFTNLFAQAVAARVAADLAITLTENRNLQADMWALYEAKLEAAGARDSQQMGNEYVQASRLTAARSGGRAL